MRIDKNYTIENDRFGWTLKYRNVSAELNDKGVNKVSVDQTFHPSLKFALKKYCDQRLKECETLNEVMNKLNEVEQIIDKL